MTINQLEEKKEEITKQLSALEILNNISLEDKASLQTYYRNKLKEYQEQIDRLSIVSQSKM